MPFTIEAIEETLNSKRKKLFVQSELEMNNPKIYPEYIQSLEEAVEEEPKFKARFLLSEKFKPEDYKLLSKVKNVKVKYLSKKAERKEKIREGFELAGRTCFKTPYFLFPWDKKDPNDPHREKLVRLEWYSKHEPAFIYLKKFISNWKRSRSYQI